MKCNICGTAKCCFGPAACGGKFRDISAAILGCFYASIGNIYVFHTEIIWAVLTIEIVFVFGV